MTDHHRDRITAAIISAWIAVTLTSFFAPGVLHPNDARFVNVGLLSAFTLWHGAVRYGWRGIAVFFVVGVLVSNFSENLSITTGFPFGHYQHTDAMGPRLWHVPVIIGPIFAAAGYFAWQLAGILLGDVFRPTATSVAIARPVIAAFITTSWDLCVDTIGGTVNRDWVWADGGPWFGVPWLNYFGWMLTMWIIFQGFAVWVARSGTIRAIPARAPYWTLVIVFWTLIALQFPLLAWLVPDGESIDPSGRVWSTSALFQSMALTSVFTMLFTSVLAAVVLQRAREIAVRG
jgi:uncharacterized membrane protein